MEKGWEVSIKKMKDLDGLRTHMVVGCSHFSSKVCGENEQWLELTP